MPATQDITLFVPGLLRPYCGGRSEIVLTVTDLRDLLAQVEAQHPALYVNLCDETGRVRQHLNLFVNSDNVRDREGLETAVATGDVITILPAVSGG